MTLDLTQPAEQIATLVAGVTDDQLDAPTPCPEMTVGTLLAHLAALAQAFTDAAAKVAGPTTRLHRPQPCRCCPTTGGR